MVSYAMMTSQLKMNFLYLDEEIQFLAQPRIVILHFSSVKGNPGKILPGN